MKSIALILALFCGAALANGKAPPSPATTSQASATSSAAATASAAPGGSYNGWAVALPGHGSPSYAGNYSICVRGRGVLWNAFWSWEPDQECVRLIADLDRLARIPVPAAKVELLTVAPPVAEPSACAPPAKAKSVQAAKASGACKL